MGLTIEPAIPPSQGALFGCFMHHLSVPCPASRPLFPLLRLPSSSLLPPLSPALQTRGALNACIADPIVVTVNGCKCLRVGICMGVWCRWWWRPRGADRLNFCAVISASSPFVFFTDSLTHFICLITNRLGRTAERCTAAAVRTQFQMDEGYMNRLID